MPPSTIAAASLQCVSWPRRFSAAAGPFANALYYRGDAIGQLEQRKKALPAFGYDHDKINLDALVRRLSVTNGQLTLPDGMTYRILVPPAPERMGPEALINIASLIEAGAVIVGPKPTGMAGLVTDPEQQKSFDALVTKLWDGSPADRLRRGHVFTGELVGALQMLHLQRTSRIQDCDEGEIDSGGCSPDRQVTAGASACQA